MHRLFLCIALWAGMSVVAQAGCQPARVENRLTDSQQVITLSSTGADVVWMTFDSHSPYGQALYTQVLTFFNISTVQQTGFKFCAEPLEPAERCFPQRIGGSTFHLCQTPPAAPQS